MTDNKENLYTTRPIEKGEEITVFYTKGYDDILIVSKPTNSKAMARQLRWLG